MNIQHMLNTNLAIKYFLSPQMRPKITSPEIRATPLNYKGAVD
jgi:hypothetical protein